MVYAWLAGKCPHALRDHDRPADAALYGAYGEDNAEYLVDLELGWYKKYTTGAYIRWKELPFPQYEAYTKRCTQYLNWTFRLFEGSSELLREFLSGSWDEERFLVVPPAGKLRRPSTSVFYVLNNPSPVSDTILVAAVSLHSTQSPHFAFLARL